MTDPTHVERARYDAAMGRLRSLMRQGIDVAEEVRAEKRRHATATQAIWRKAHPELVQAAARRSRAAHLEDRKKRDLQYRKDHPEKQAAAMRRYRARQKILAEFMAIDESVFA